MGDIIENSIQYWDGSDLTMSYHKYNVFGLTSPTQVFYDLFKELRGFVYDYMGDCDSLWMQSWLNYHMPHEVLKWHNHSWPVHGYINVRPHKTKTNFGNYEVDNEIGLIYIGPGDASHKVDVIEEYDTPRITLGFDLTDRPEKASANLGLIPFP